MILQNWTQLQANEIEFVILDTGTIEKEIRHIRLAKLNSSSGLTKITQLGKINYYQRFRETGLCRVKSNLLAIDTKSSQNNRLSQGRTRIRVKGAYNRFSILVCLPNWQFSVKIWSSHFVCIFVSYTTLLLLKQSAFAPIGLKRIEIYVWILIWIWSRCKI